MLDVVGIGAASVDYVYRLPARPQFEGAAAKLRLSGHVVSYGGQVATALAACARFGLASAFAGAVGDDEGSRALLAALDRHGVDTSLAVRRPGGSQFAVILVDERSGERVVLWDRPASLCLADNEVPVAAIRRARAVLVDDVDARASLTAARLAREAGVPVVTDLDHVTPFTEDLVRTASHPVPSEHLPAALTGEADLERALRRLRTDGTALLTVTLGARGAAAVDGDRFVEVPGFVVPAADTTGAGDVFRGALIAGLLRGLPPVDLLRFANAAAALSCTKAGALASVPALDEVWRLLRDGR